MIFDIQMLLIFEIYSHLRLTAGLDDAIHLVKRDDFDDVKWCWFVQMVIERKFFHWMYMFDMNNLEFT